MIPINNYKNIIFDFDGTIAHTNDIKKLSIKKAVAPYCSKVFLEEFIDYFTHNNGLPREEKINKFFDKNNCKQILKEYNSLLSEVKKVQLTIGVKDFINKIEKTHKLFILSGGDKQEIINILDYHNITSKFDAIYTAPKNKYDNIKNIETANKTLYFGDSIIDYEISKIFNCDFVFIYGYTQFDGWKEYYKNKDILTVKNFKYFMEHFLC